MEERIRVVGVGKPTMDEVAQELKRVFPQAEVSEYDVKTSNPKSVFTNLEEAEKIEVQHDPEIIIEY